MVHRGQHRRLMLIGTSVLLACAACSSSSDSKSVTSTLTSKAETVSSTLTSEAQSAATDVANRVDDAKKALQDGNFSLMAEAFDLSGVAKDINQHQATILAPTDTAFNALDKKDYQDLLTNPTKLKGIVRRHILDDRYTYDQLKTMTSVKTVDGETLPISVSGDELTIDGAKVSPPTNTQAEGDPGQEFVVLGIDKVLLTPPS